MSSNKTHVLILISSFAPGGAEKSGIKLARQLADRTDFKVSLVALTPFQKPITYSPPNNVNYIMVTPFSEKDFRIKQYKFIFNKLGRLRWWFNFRRTISKQNVDTLLSFGAEIGCKAYIFLYGLRIRQVNCERNEMDPNIISKTLIERILRPHIYKHGVLCSVQTEIQKEFVDQKWNIKALLTPNFFDINQNESHKARTKFDETLKLIFVGKDSFQKNPELLIAVWNYISTKISVSLTIYGNWTEKNKSEILGPKVTFVNPTSELESHYKNFDCLISTSRYEGFPNVVAEALIAGLPVISTLSTRVLLNWGKDLPCFVFSDQSDTSFERFVAEQLGSYLRETHHFRIESLNRLFSWEANRDLWISCIKGQIK
jgi:glycosyltransferase involved in cell wall biosynthesis